MRKHVGFTLVELIIVVILIGIIAAMAVPRFFNVTSIAYVKTVAGTAKAFKEAVNAAKGQWIASGEPNSGIDYKQLGGSNLNLNCSNTYKWPNAAITGTGQVSLNTDSSRSDAVGNAAATPYAACANLMSVLFDGSVSVAVGSSGATPSTDATLKTCGSDWCAFELATSIMTGLVDPATGTYSGTSGMACRYNYTKDGSTNRWVLYNVFTGEVTCTNCTV